MILDKVLYCMLFLLTCLATSLVLCTIHHNTAKMIIKETAILFFYFVGGGVVLSVITYFLTV